jgi:hypothetical protein
MMVRVHHTEYPERPRAESSGYDNSNQEWHGEKEPGEQERYEQDAVESQDFPATAGLDETLSGMQQRAKHDDPPGGPSRL